MLGAVMLCIVSVPEWEGVGAAPECWGAVTPPCPSSWSSQWDFCLLFVCVQFGNFWDIYIPATLEHIYHN